MDGKNINFIIQSLPDDTYTLTLHTASHGNTILITKEQYEQLLAFVKVLREARNATT